MQSLSDTLLKYQNEANQRLSRFQKLNKSITSKSLFELIEGLSGGAIEILNIITNPNKTELSNNIGSKNKDGDETKSLDIIADKIIERVSKNNFVKWYASEEQEEILSLNEKGVYALSVDPLDGSSNIETNAPIGTIFSIYVANSKPEHSVLQKGELQLAAGFFIYGPRTILVLTFGSGTMAFQLNKNKHFMLLNEKLVIKEITSEFAINMSNYRHWTFETREYIDNCLQGIEGKNKKNYNMRWIGSLVADAWRIFTRGGIFLYPEDFRKGYENGRLRLVYEANAIAFLVEQACGEASNGFERILNMKPKSLHQRTSLIFGSKNEVTMIVKNKS